MPLAKIAAPIGFDCRELCGFGLNVLLSSSYAVTVSFSAFYSAASRLATPFRQATIFAEVWVGDPYHTRVCASLNIAIHFRNFIKV